MAFTVEDFEDLLRILEEKPEWQQRMRQAILTRELLELPARFEQLVELVHELVEAQRRTEARVEELAEAQRRTDERVAELTAIVQELAQISRDTIRRLERLENWQQGETGRREGERYEREVVARAPALFTAEQAAERANPMCASRSDAGSCPSSGRESI